MVNSVGKELSDQTNGWASSWIQPCSVSLTNTSPVCSVLSCCLRVCPAWRTKLAVLARKKQHPAFYCYSIQDKQGYWLTSYEWVEGLLVKLCLLLVCSRYECSLTKVSWRVKICIFFFFVLCHWRDEQTPQFFIKVHLMADWSTERLQWGNMIKPAEQRLTIISLLVFCYC